jgi:hypothetical protein
MGYAARFWLPSRAKSRNIDLYRLQHRRVHRHPTGDGRDTPRSGGAEPTRIAGSGPGSSEIPPGTLSTAFRGRRHTLTSMWCISMLLILIQSGITPRQIAPRFVADSPLEGDGFEPPVPGTKEPVFVAEGELRDRTGAAKKGCFLCGTDGSNPTPSSGESDANLTSSPWTRGSHST